MTSTSPPTGGTPAGASAPDAGTTAAALLVERLATFLKACFIYPDNNQRVLVTGELVLDSLREHFARRPMVEVVVGSHDLVVCGSRLPLRSHAQTWLRDLFIKALIGGVELTPAVDAQSLTAAARRLQRSQIGKERGLAVWTEPIPGLRTRELVMSGSHVAGDADCDEGGAPGTLSGTRSARTRALEATLAASPRVRNALAQLRAVVSTAGGDEPSAVIDVIAELVQCLPAEARHDHAYAEALAEKILAAARSELGKAAPSGGAGRDAVASTFLSLGKKMFAATVGGELPAASGGRGHGDETVTDSLGDLLADLNRLEVEERGASDYERWQREAATLQAPTAAAGLEASAATELIGIVLHAMTHEGGVHEPTVCRYLTSALAAGDEARALFRDYFAAALTGDDVDQRPAWRLVRIAGDPAVTTALRAANLLEPEEAARHFPKTFGLFLDTLDDADGGQRLARLARAVEPATLAAAPAWLDKCPDLLTPPRIERFFACVSQRSLGLMPLVLQHGGQECKALAAKCLRQLGLGGAASVALRVVNPPGRLPREYLEQLCRWAADGSRPSAELVTLSGSLTRSYIQTLAGDVEQEARRIFAIQALCDLPGSETRVLLQDLVRAGGLLFKRESRAVRRAARATMAMLASKTEGRR